VSRYLRNLIIALIILAVLFGLDFVFQGRLVNPYYTRILMLCGISITLAVSLNLINGFTGQFSIGHAGFMAVGAYSSAYFSVTWGMNLANSLGGGMYQFSFGSGVTAGDTVSYYIVAEDTASPANVGAFPSTGAGNFTADPPAAGTPPTSPSSYLIQASISGSFTVGVGGNYTTITAAVADLNSKVISAPVTMSVLRAAWSPWVGRLGAGLVTIRGAPVLSFELLGDRQHWRMQGSAASPGWSSCCFAMI